jgi:hypothetical protein
MTLDRQDSFYAKVALFLSLGFWIPLLNIPLSVAAIIFGLTALNLNHKYPQRYGGRGYAVAGIVIGLIPLVLGLSILLIPSARERVLQDMMVQNMTLFGK